MKDFIRKKLNESLRDYHVKPSAIIDKYQIGEYDDYDFDDFDDYGSFDDLDFIDEPIASKKISGDIKAYHGTTHKINNFTTEFVGGDKAKDQEGPGIYFTTDKSETLDYAGEDGYIYSVILNVNNLVSNESKHNLDYLTEKVTKLIKMSPNWRLVARGYNADVEEGVDEMVASYIKNSQSEKEVFVAIYMDVYQGNAPGFVKNMVGEGYDGLYLPTKGGGAHIVVYNPSIIKIVKEEKV